MGPLYDAPRGAPGVPETVGPQLLPPGEATSAPALAEARSRGDGAVAELLLRRPGLHAALGAEERRRVAVCLCELVRDTPTMLVDLNPMARALLVEAILEAESQDALHALSGHKDGDALIGQMLASIPERRRPAQAAALVALCLDNGVLAEHDARFRDEVIGDPDLNLTAAWYRAKDGSTS